LILEQKYSNNSYISISNIINLLGRRSYLWSIIW